MAQDIRYAIKRCGKWLQGIEANSNYVCGACAPTMGARHTLTEYRTVWGNDQKFFERLTVVSYLGVLFEEYRWEEKKYTDIKIIPSAGGGNFQNKISKWEYFSNNGVWTPRCANCGHISDLTEYSFCPKCGARMDSK